MIEHEVRESKSNKNRDFPGYWINNEIEHWLKFINLLKELKNNENDFEMENLWLSIWIVCVSIIRWQYQFISYSFNIEIIQFRGTSSD